MRILTGYSDCIVSRLYFFKALVDVE